MSERILCVDDEPNVLEGLRRGLRNRLTIDTAQGAAEALALLEQTGPYAVVVSDLRMPGMDGIRFLAEVRQRAPHTVRIMLTGNADQQSAIDAVNEGRIFRFLCKPCPSDVLAQAIGAGLEQYRLITAEQELLEKTLSGSVKVLTDVLALVNPTACGRAQRLRRTAQSLAAQMGVAALWEIEVAALLSQLGLLVLPTDTVEKLYHGKALSTEERRQFAAHPRIGSEWVRNIPRLAEVAEIIAYQEKCFDGSGIPEDDRAGAALPLGARILKVALDFDAHSLRGLTWREALTRLRERAAWYDPEVLAALHAVAGIEAHYDLRSAHVCDLTCAMIINEDVRAATGMLLVSKGQDVTPSLRARLRTFAQQSPIREPIQVLVRPPGAPLRAPADGGGVTERSMKS
jgi:response regulator RpfG family c-di-GMP phosphodiesterase